MCGIRNWSNLPACFILFFGDIAFQRIENLFHTQDVLFIKPRREYHMTLLFYLSTLGAGLNFAQMEKPLGKTQFEWVCLRISVRVPIQFETHTSTVVSIKSYIIRANIFTIASVSTQVFIIYRQGRAISFLYETDLQNSGRKEFPKVPKFHKRFYWNGPNKMHPHYYFGRLLSVPII
jgi:hypothetical protein